MLKNATCFLRGCYTFLNVQGKYELHETVVNKGKQLVIRKLDRELVSVGSKSIKIKKIAILPFRE